MGHRCFRVGDERRYQAETAIGCSLVVFVQNSYCGKVATVLGVTQIVVGDVAGLVFECRKDTITKRTKLTGHLCSRNDVRLLQSLALR